MSSRQDELTKQLAQLEELGRSGVLPAEQVAKARARLQAELAQAGGDAEPAPRVPARLWAGVAGFVVVFAAAGYAWLGNQAGWQVGPGKPGNAAAVAGGEAAQIEAMVAKLADRLKSKPDDAEGWTMLGRSYSVLGRYDEAVPAFQKVVSLRPRDAQALADLADAVGMRNGRSLEGEPEKLIEQALQVDGKNLKALALAGTVAFQRGDFARAVKHWELAVSLAEPGSDLVNNLQGGIAEARQRGNLLGASPAPASSPAAATGTSVSGRVTLSAALKAKAAPEDTVFVFARAAQGPKMPLAILKKQVKDLPLEFTLDDSLAMSPAARLSSAGQVVVGARISKSGNATPQPGDLQVLSAPVAVGASGLAIEIAEEVK